MLKSMILKVKIHSIKTLL